MNTGEQPFRNSFGNLVGKNQTIHLSKMEKQEMTFNYLKLSKTMTIQADYNRLKRSFSAVAKTNNEKKVQKSRKRVLEGWCTFK